MKLVALPGTKRGSSGCNGMTTVPLPPFVTRSRPWSKNCPKNVNIRLNGAPRPKLGVMFGMKSPSAKKAIPILFGGAREQERAATPGRLAGSDLPSLDGAAGRAAQGSAGRLDDLA